MDRHMDGLRGREEESHAVICGTMSKKNVCMHA